jgi:S1-C subfamily serine protease
LSRFDDRFGHEQQEDGDMRMDSVTCRRLAPWILAISFLALEAPNGLAQEASDADKKLVENHKNILVSVMKKVNSSFIFIGGGSGVIISQDGHMLTNNHVARSKAVWAVHTPGGKRYTANVVGSDPRGDLTLLKLVLKDGARLPYVKLGNSDKAKAGDTVFAVGNPIGIGRDDYSPTFTLGVISVVNHNHANYTDCIQTDAPINPGNSGGPLLNLKGELLGINGMIQTRFQSRVNSGVGYAISVERIKLWLPVLKKARGGSIPHATASGIAVRRNLAESGALVARSTGTAAAAGIKSGDRIIKVDDRPVRNHARFTGIIGMYPGGSSVKMTITRGREQVIISLTLDARGSITRRNTQPRNRGNRAGGAYLGCRLSAAQGGAKIDEIVANGPMSKAPFKVGDVIVKFNGKAVASYRALVGLLRNAKVGDKATFTVKRGGKELDVPMTLGSRPGRRQ